MKKVNKQLGVLQRAGAEKLGRAEKSVEELPEHLTIVQRHHEQTRVNCERVCKRLHGTFQGSGSEYEKRVRKLPQSALANMFHEAGSEMGTTPLGQVMDLCGDVTQRIAMQTACMELMVETELLTPLTTFLESDANHLEKLFKKLQKSRLEMDSSASKVHKLEKRPVGTPLPEQEERRLRLELDSAESKFNSLQSQYITELLEVAAKEHKMTSHFVSIMEDQVRYHEECLSRLRQTVPKMRGIVDNTPFRPAFGVDLGVHCLVNNRTVSQVIESCCAALLPHIDCEEGLFRLAGPVSQVKKLRAHMDYGLYDFSEASPHTITGALKLYLRELPNPLFVYEMYDIWKHITMMTDHDEKLQTLYTQLHSMPQVHYDNTKYLMCFLNRMIQHRETTKMGASNLALVIGPNLFVSQKQSDDGQIQDTGPFCILVEHVIEHSDYFFPEGIEDTSSENETEGNTTMDMLEATARRSNEMQMKAQEGLHKAQESLSKGANSSGNSSARNRVISGADKAAAKASSAVSNLRSKLGSSSKDKPEKPTTPGRSPAHPPQSPPPPSSSASYSSRPAVPPAGQEHPSRGLSPTERSMSPSPHGPSPPPRPPVVSRQSSGGVVTSRPAAPSAPPPFIARRPAVPSRNRATTD